jgi:tyrosyl-tRNA synthetase
MIQQGAVELDGQPIHNLNYAVMTSSTPHLLKVGKRRFKRFVLVKE